MAAPAEISKTPSARLRERVEEIRRELDDRPEGMHAAVRLSMRRERERCRRELERRDRRRAGWVS